MNTETPYSLAWKEYKEAKHYVQIEDRISIGGMKQPYIDNVIRGTFDAGYNANAAALKHEAEYWKALFEIREKMLLNSCEHHTAMKEGEHSLADDLHNDFGNLSIEYSSFINKFPTAQHYVDAKMMEL